MSRAYRIRVSESSRRILRAGDHVETCLELLEVLPREDMAALLKQALTDRGFRQDGDVMKRSSDSTTVSIQLTTGVVRVESSVQAEVELTAEGQSWTDTDFGRRGQRHAEQTARANAQREIESEAQRRTEKLTEQATEVLEQTLRDLQREMDQVANSVTAEALKIKARQLGEIKQMTEDPESGSLTIVLEV